MRICAVGDNVVDRYRDWGVMYPGGNAVNVAVHARRRQASAAYVGVLGDDVAGRLLASSLAAEEVECTRVRTVSGPTAYAVVRHDRGSGSSTTVTPESRCSVSTPTT